MAQAPRQRQRPQRGRQGGLKATELHIGEALRGETPGTEVLGAGKMFALDEFSGETKLLLPIPRPGGERAELPKNTTDTDITMLIEWFQHMSYEEVSRGRMDHAVTLEGWRNRFSSAEDWLTGLPAWDEVPRLEKFWIDICGVDPVNGFANEDEIHDYLRYLHATARCTFIGIVARIMDPGCKLDTVPILEGEQGTFKSTLLRVIARRDVWFSDSMVADLRNKDARQHLSGKLVIELPEMSQIKGSQVETMKAFLSARDDKFRPAYGRRDVMHRRQCVFIGTTNDDEYLFDLTGNRRFWPIRCGKIDINKAEATMDQLYAEALVAWRQGELHHLPSDIEIIASREQLARVATDPLEQYVREEFVDTRLNAVNGGDTAWIRTSEVIDKIESSWGKRDKALEMRVGGVLRKLGGKRKQIPRGRPGHPGNGYAFSKRQGG